MSRSANRPRREREGVSASRPQLESLEPRDVPTVNYFGGNLLPHVEAQALYYGSEWTTGTPASQTATTDAFLADLTGGAYMDALTRAGYGVGRGTASPGAVDPGTITANSVISDASIRSRIQADINSGLLQAPDANRLYVVYVEPNVVVNLGAGQGTTQQGVLGYHGAFGGTDAAGNPVTIRYAVIAYPGGTVGNSSLNTAAIDQLTAVASHELAEAVTDPDVNYSTLGWYDRFRGEIGDITENNPNALVRLDGYLVQEVADRNDQLLPIFASTPPVSPPPVSPPPAPSRVATSTTLSVGPVSYHGWYATATLTVTIKPASGSAIPGGRVALFYGGRVLGVATVSVVDGVATANFNIVFYANGNYTFGAEYIGTSQFAPSLSNPVNVLV